MKTVIITTDTSDAFLREYQSLFFPFEQSGEIAICHWNRQGSDFRTALPELHNIVRTSPKWRALVVLPLEEDTQLRDEYPTLPENPYDFVCNASRDSQRVEESGVPLIRLAQMLGGVPKPVYDFEDCMAPVDTEQANGKRFCRQTVLNTRQEDLEQDRRTWVDLEEKYAFTGEKPVELWMLAACRRQAAARSPLPEDMPAPPREDALEQVPFAVRNGYPACTRFMKMECTGQGHAHYRMDEMRFWMAVLTLALNDYDSGRLRGGELYQVHNDFDVDLYQQLLSDYYNRLGRIRSDVERRENLLHQKQDEARAPTMPAYSFTVSVEQTTLNDTGLYVDDSSVGLSSDCPQPELKWWRGQMEASRKALARVIAAPRRSLDRACAYARRNAQIEPAQVVQMDRYQQDELENILNEEEIQLFGIDAFDALPVKEFYRRRNVSDRDVRGEMNRRMSRNLTIGAGVLALLVYLAGFVPELVHLLLRGEPVGEMLYVLATHLLGLFLTGLITLLVFRYWLHREVKEYNHTMQWIVLKIATSCNFFSDYLSRVSSYMRGRSINTVLRSRDQRLSEEGARLERHLLAIQKNSQRAADWIENFGLEILQDENRGQVEYFNSDIPPEKNEVYDLRASTTEQAVDSDGQRVRVPYPFVKPVDFKREERFA